MLFSEKKLHKLTEIALNECEKHDFFVLRKQRHVSLILYKNRLVSVGVNAFRTHPMAYEIGYRYSEVHSEVDAFIRCSQRKKLTLINFRFNKKGQLRNSTPCKLCLPWVTSLFDTIYHSTDDGKIKIFTSIKDYV